MEFDPQVFMAEVNAALSHVPPSQGDSSDDEAAQTQKRYSGADALDFLSFSDDHASPPGIDESLDKLPDCLKPDTDMTTALQSSSTSRPWLEGSSQHGSSRSSPEGIGLGGIHEDSLDTVHSFYSYSVKAYLSPIRKVQHELFTLYFQYIHPMFPVVDEDYFTEIHRKYRGQEQHMPVLDFVIYQAITAAGFGHISENLLFRTPYRSVHEGQETLFDQIKERYWSNPTSDPVILTQLCLILSLWSPEVSGPQNNSYWINMAFKNANAGELWISRPVRKGRPCRRRLIWWCCLVRDRVLALGMRRPYRLHKAPSEEDMITHEDFGVGSSPSSSMDDSSRKIAELAFIWLCKISEIMAAIAIFQRQTRFSREWNGETISSSISELEEVVRFDRNLSKCKAEFEETAWDVIRGRGEQDVPTPVAILRIVCNSLVAVLYQPYLHLSWIEHVYSGMSSIDPLQRMKEGSQEVESSIVGLISSKKWDALPNWLVSWVTLPLAVYYVNRNAILNSSPDRVLMPFYNRFMRRTTGAQALFLALTIATKEFRQKLNDTNQASEAKTHNQERDIAPSTQRPLGVDSASDVKSRVVEAQMLAHVTRVLDITLELKCS